MRSIAEKRLWSTCLRRWTAGPTRIWASIGRLAQFGAVKRTAGMPSRPPVGRRGWGPDRRGGSAPGACAGRFHVSPLVLPRTRRTHVNRSWTAALNSFKRLPVSSPQVDFPSTPNKDWDPWPRLRVMPITPTNHTEKTPKDSTRVC
ncbi:hypothetical protein B296_00055517 [Ensete ventricosum]|uniref:Uncharacterized protein n=1 Tax=Ensete ventricosum TaxID=4639 RepID=A0A426XR67_ENSVE|nr:hypothetical protein B296_00055517 [Ensete ventricosum]